jgi:nodulation protein E
VKRVVITGSGTINSIGQNVLQTMDSLKEGQCGISDLIFKDVERLSVKIGGQIHDFEPDKHFNRQQLALYDRYTQLTLLAVKKQFSNLV